MCVKAGVYRDVIIAKCLWPHKGWKNYGLYIYVFLKDKET